MEKKQMTWTLYYAALVGKSISKYVHAFLATLTCCFWFTHCLQIFGAQTERPWSLNDYLPSSRAATCTILGLLDLHRRLSFWRETSKARQPLLWTDPPPSNKANLPLFGGRGERAKKCSHQHREACSYIMRTGMHPCSYVVYSYRLLLT